MTTEKRIGVVTINDDANFGNRLQAFALQRALATLGATVEFIRNTPPPMSRKFLAKRALHAVRADGPIAVMRRNATQAVGRRHQGDNGMGGGIDDSSRREAIAAFARENLTITAEDFTERSSGDWAARYDFVIVGSDQVWNFGFRNGHDIDFLTFASPEKRIAYAASFGVHNIPSYLRERYRTGLNGLSRISVREQRGAEIVEELTGRTVPVVVDPTLLLTRDQWAPVRRAPPTEPTGRYAAQFFLGESTREQQAAVSALAERRNAALVDLNDLQDPHIAAMSPGGFVEILANAEFVATDSFHTGVFALLHHRPTLVRSRDETDSRLHTLYDTQGIELHRTSAPGLTSALNPDWSRADDLLAASRESSWRFLRESTGALRSAG
nr:polysaccharide pyruvyl transferase family protein [Microbacterium bovistercoris]